MASLGHIPSCELVRKASGNFKMKSIVSSKVMALGAAVLLCLIINCSSAPVIESSAVLANSFEGEVDSAEVETAGDHRREGRFLKDIFNSIPPFTGGGYYPNPYYYSG